MDIKQILLSKKQAARAISVSLRTVDNLIAAKELPVRRVGRRTLIPSSALEQFARRDHVDFARKQQSQLARSTGGAR